MTSSSLFDPPSITTSRCYPLVPIEALGKIPRLKPAPSASSSIETTENSSPLDDQTHALHIYQGKNIVFFGDITIRLLYRDLAKLLHKNKKMSDAELRQHRSDHPLYANEIRIETSGSLGMCNRVDCRRYFHKESSTTLYFIQLGTILNVENPITVEWLQQITEYNPIDLVVVSCANPDLSFRQIESMNSDFHTTLQTFISELPIVLTKLNSAFYNREQRQAIMIWIPPIPYRILDLEESQQFAELLYVCSYITTQLKFYHLTRMDPWLLSYKRLYVKEACYLSSTGIRLLTTQIIEIYKENQHHSPYQDLLQPIGTSIPVPSISIPMMDFKIPIEIDADDQYRQNMMDKRKEEKAQNKILRKQGRARNKTLKKQAARKKRAKQKLSKRKIP